MTPPGAAPEQHTPGPWTVNGSHVYAPDGAIIAVVQNPGSRESDYPLVANRNLIARAPALHAENEALRKGLEELLAAAHNERMVRFASALHTSDEDNCPNPICQAITKARALLRPSVGEK